MAGLGEIFVCLLILASDCVNQASVIEEAGWLIAIGILREVSFIQKIVALLILVIVDEISQN